METSSQFLLTIGGILLLGLLASTIGHRTFLPRVTLLLIFGVIIGEEVLDIIPAVFTEYFEIIANIALLMVGFLLGGKLSRKSLAHSTGKVLWISITAAIITVLTVSVALFWVGVETEVAILLGCIASATAPAAVLDVTNEYGIKTHFREILLSIVTLDDIWALMLFSFGMALVSSLNGNATEHGFIIVATIEIGGAILLGILLGLPAAFMTGRIKPGQPMVTEALTIVFICGGLALWLGVSFMVASIVLGTVVANLARHHEYPFHAIEDIEWPFMIIFFVLAGVSLEPGALKDLGLIGFAYIIFRSMGKIIGARLGSEISRASDGTKKWMGVALLPQAGVAIGMALVASNQFPQYQQVLLSVVISSTVIFEIIGPVFTRLALKHTQQEL